MHLDYVRVTNHIDAMGFELCYKPWVSIRIGPPIRRYDNFYNTWTASGVDYA